MKRAHDQPVRAPAAAAPSLVCLAPPPRPPLTPATAPPTPPPQGSVNDLARAVKRANLAAGGSGALADAAPPPPLPPYGYADASASGYGAAAAEGYGRRDAAVHGAQDRTGGGAAAAEAPPAPPPGAPPEGSHYGASNALLREMHEARLRRHQAGAPA